MIDTTLCMFSFVKTGLYQYATFFSSFPAFILRQNPTGFFLNIAVVNPTSNDLPVVESDSDKYG